jgi:hypothetical protein
LNAQELFLLTVFDEVDSLEKHSPLQDGCGTRPKPPLSFIAQSTKPQELVHRCIEWRLTREDHQEELWKEWIDLNKKGKLQYELNMRVLAERL